MTAAVRIWDLPTRLFHWTLALLVAASFITAELGGNWMDWHMRSGYAILSLLLFRLIWGFVGSRYARFMSFVRGPQAVMSYVRGLHNAPDSLAGHNPLGALSVLALLLVLLVQAGTGLFANDAIATEGPLAKLVSSAWSDRLTSVHKLGESLIYALVGLHVAAVLFYVFIKRDNVLRPMITGDKAVQAEPARDDWVLRLGALVVLALASASVVWLINR